MAVVAEPRSINDQSKGEPAWVPPMRLGGIGLRSAQRTAQAAYWASWADALPVLLAKRPVEATRFQAALEQQHTAGCLGEAARAAHALHGKGFTACPTWTMVARGERPETPLDAEPGEWRHGWQYLASSHIETHFREQRCLASMRPRAKAMLRSSAGPFAGS